MAVGPTVEMTDVVEHHGLGIVSRGFSVADVVDSLHTLTPERVVRFKEASHAAAHSLSFENEAEVARGIMRRLLGA